MLQVREITKYYGSKMAIENISFQAEKGQVIGLLGHNGCGKTTSMSIITNCLAPSWGDVLLDGISVQQEPLKAKAKIGYLPELPPVYPDMTVNEQLRFACDLRGIPHRQQEKQIAAACEDLNITGVRGRLIQNLSKGYRQRVGFAQALIGRPPLLVLDEPMVGLDPQQIIDLRKLIVRLKQEHTVILSSHILSEIAMTCDRIVVLSNGHLVADDTLEGLVQRVNDPGALVLQADGTETAVMGLIRSVPGVEKCTIHQSLTNSKPEYHIQAKADADIHQQLVRTLDAGGCTLRMLKPAQASLEDVFLRLTRDRRYETGKGEK